jgi:hypothetical protein
MSTKNTKTVGRPRFNVSRDQLRKEVKMVQATTKFEAAKEIGGKLGCSWVTVWNLAKAKGVNLPTAASRPSAK